MLMVWVWSIDSTWDARLEEGIELNDPPPLRRFGYTVPLCRGVSGVRGDWR